LAAKGKSILFLLFAMCACAQADSLEFALLTDSDNIQRLPQRQGWVGFSGDHLIQTGDDIFGSTYNPDGCFSFNFMNPVGIEEPDYPPGYAEGIHSMTGSVTLNINGNTVEITSLAFDGYVAEDKPSAHQRLVEPNDPATDGNYGPVDGIPNNGTYTPSSDANWALEVNFDWYYDTPFAGPGGIDMTFDNYLWSGFIVPISKLTSSGMAATTLDDPLGFFEGTCEDFESWLLTEVAPKLPPEATFLLFAQGEAHPDWTNPMMGMTIDGIVGKTTIGYSIMEFWPNKADLDKDWDVDLSDFAILANQWHQIPGEPSADIAPPGDGIVDINDFAFLMENWLWGN